MKQNEHYASPRLEILKELVEKIELCRKRKNLSPIEKLIALKQAHYRVYETGFLSVTRPLRYQSIETRHNLPQHLSCQLKDALEKFINAMLKVFDGGFDARIGFLKSVNTAGLRHCRPGNQKRVINIYHINKIRLCRKLKLSLFDREEHEGHEKGF